MTSLGVNGRERLHSRRGAGAYHGESGGRLRPRHLVPWRPWQVRCVGGGRPLRVVRGRHVAVGVGRPQEAAGASRSAADIESRDVVTQISLGQAGLLVVVVLMGVGESFVPGGIPRGGGHEVYGGAEVNQHQEGAKCIFSICFYAPTSIHTYQGKPYY